MINGRFNSIGYFRSLELTCIHRAHLDKKLPNIIIKRNTIVKLK